VEPAADHLARRALERRPRALQGIAADLPQIAADDVQRCPTGSSERDGLADDLRG
jgi:hypothetical protein